MIKRLLQYIRIEYKRTAAVFVRVLVSLLLLIAAMGIIALGSAFALYQGGMFEPIHVGIVVKDDDRELALAVRLIMSMESISRFCALDAMSEKEAEQGLKAGELDGAIVLQENFYEDINTGINTPATVILPPGGTLGGSLFREFLEAGVSMVDTAEAGIYAVTDASRVYEMKLSRTEMEELLTGLYTGAVLKRGDCFEALVASPLGELNIVDHFALAAILGILLLTGFYFGFLYSPSDLAAEQKLLSGGIGPVLTGAVKLFVMTTVLLVLCLLLNLCFSGALSLFKLRAGKFLPSDLPFLLVLCFSVAGFFHFVYSLGSNAHSNKNILLLLELILIALSGIVLPVAYFPGALKGAFSCLPGFAWLDLLTRTMSASVTLTAFAPALLYGLGFSSAGILLQWKRLR
ncbi:MAG: ABC transporter permease [Lachnospiraceae bacterium]|nr:ABC transporter permease [Lachnospiraceae bacterium]